MAQVVFPLGPGSFGLFPADFTLFQIIRIITCIAVEMSPVYFNNVIGNPGKEITVMGDQYHGFVRFHQILLQPENHLLIKMVGRLIQKIEICLPDQSNGQSKALLLTA